MKEKTLFACTCVEDNIFAIRVVGLQLMEGVFGNIFVDNLNCGAFEFSQILCFTG
jgi:hypothetical protein